MRARRQGTNNPYTRIEKIQLENSDILYSSDVMEFDVQPDDFPSKEEILDESYWQEVRNQAAIAAMQGTITTLSDSNRSAFREIIVEGFTGGPKTYPNEIANFAIACADALIEQLKKK